MTDATRLPRALRPFSSGQYRLLVAALAASLLSAGAWLVAAVWQVVELGGSPIDLSYVAVGSSLGLVLAVLVGGVAADRIPQRRILFAVEIVRGLAFAVAAVLAATGVIEVWQIAVLSFVLGLADGFFYPAYSAWLPAILPAGQLLAANGIEGVLRPAVMQAAGPALASVLIAVQAPWLAFAVVAGLQVVAAVGARRHAHDAGAPRSRRGGGASAPPVVHRPARRVRLPAAHAVAVRDAGVLDHPRASSSWGRSRCCCRSP